MINIFGGKKAPKAIATYGAPGEGNSPLMSTASIVLILGGWFLITQPIWGNGIIHGMQNIAQEASVFQQAGDPLQKQGNIIADAAAEIEDLHRQLETGGSESLSDGLDDLTAKVEDMASQVNYAVEDATAENNKTAEDAASRMRTHLLGIQKKINDIREVERKGGELSLDIALIKPLFVPSPQAVVGRFISLFSEEFSGGTLQHHIWESCRRVFLAFILAILSAVPLGVLMGINRRVRGFFDPPIEFYRPIPPLAYLPLMIVWFGIGEEPKVLLIFLAIFAPLVINARAGVRSVAIEQVHAAYSMGATKLQVIWHVILKGALPEILTGMRIGIAFGWTTLVAAELAAAQAGLGAMIKSASDFLVTDVIFVGILVIAAIAYLFDMGMRWIDKVAVPWKGRI